MNMKSVFSVFFAALFVVALSAGFLTMAPSASAEDGKASCCAASSCCANGKCPCPETGTCTCADCKCANCPAKGGKCCGAAKSGVLLLRRGPVPVR